MKVDQFAITFEFLDEDFVDFVNPRLALDFVLHKLECTMMGIDLNHLVSVL